MRANAKVKRIRMASGAVLQVRRCRLRAAHDPHRWRGLNTRHHGYYCVGVGLSQVADLSIEDFGD